MGTRHLTAVILKEKPKVAQYGQWDGYPGGQDLKILNFLKKCQFEKFKEQISKCRFLSEEELLNKWKEFGVNKDDKLVSCSVSIWKQISSFKQRYGCRCASINL
jgi:hypothetical protein